MLWLIQRDFLQGATVQAMVTQALQPVANPSRDADIEQVLFCQFCLSPAAAILCVWAGSWLKQLSARFLAAHKSVSVSPCSKSARPGSDSRQCR